MRTILCGGVLLAALVATVAWTEDKEVPRGPDALSREIAAMTPKEHVWRAIAWQNCPLAALAESRRTQKPVLVWVFLGNPADERC